MKGPRSLLSGPPIRLAGGRSFRGWRAVRSGDRTARWSFWTAVPSAPVRRLSGEESGSFLCSRKPTGVPRAEEAVAAFGELVIHPVTKGPGNDHQHRRDPIRKAEFSTDPQDGRGPIDDVVTIDDNDRVGPRPRGATVARHDLSACALLIRGEHETLLVVVTEQEVDPVIAYRADAVEHDDELIRTRSISLTLVHQRDRTLRTRPDFTCAPTGA